MTGKYGVHDEYEESKLHALLERILNALATMDVRKQIFQRITDNDYNYYMYKIHSLLMDIYHEKASNIMSQMYLHILF